MWGLLKPGANPNFHTCGIEHEGRPDDVWPDAQLPASAALILQVAARWAIPLDSQHVFRDHEIRASKDSIHRCSEIPVLTHALNS
jgi:hypothetical protein